MARRLSLKKLTETAAKNYGNVIHPPMLDNNDDETLVITIIPPPELHLMLGPENTMYNGLVKVWSDSETWLRECNVKKSDYHGGDFTCPDCKKLFRVLRTLEEWNSRFFQVFPGNIQQNSR